MRHYIKSFLITIASFYITITAIPALALGHDIKNVILFIGGLWIISQIIKPIFSLVLLPVNILTFGLVSLLINIAFVFALLNFLPGFSISAYHFPGAIIQGVIFPPISFNQIYTILLIAASITILQKILHIIFE